MSDKKKKSVVIALGYFDSVHIGHRKVIETAKSLAKNFGAQAAVFTFDGNLKAFFGDGFDKSIYNTNERKLLLKNLGISEIYFAPLSKTYLQMDRKEFLDSLNSFYDIIGYVSGDDYKFGKDRLGDVEYLKQYADSHNQKCIVAKEQKINKRRVSTTLIKEYLSKGDIKSANVLLKDKYFLIGKVVEGRKDGRKMGYPTANVNIDKDKFRLRSGVYSGVLSVDDKKYRSVINYGNTPTFNDVDNRIEIHVLDFNGNLYGKEIKLEFTSYIREIKKFSSIADLEDRIKLDVDIAREESI